MGFHNVSYQLPPPTPWWGWFPLLRAREKGKRTNIEEGGNVVKDVSGWVSRGGLLGIMGASGAGKTTLLDILSGRTKVGKVGGQILLENRRVDRESLRECSAYVMQDDALLPNLTVRETLSFGMKLRVHLLPPAAPTLDKWD